MDQAQGLRNLIKEQNKRVKSARVITVTSGKGGVGKTSISINLAIQLKRMGKRVVVLDADFGLANVEILLGVRPKYTMSDLIYENKKMRDIIVEGPEQIGFISGGSGIQSLVNISQEKISLLVEQLYELDELADIIIIDTGAGITDSVLEFVDASEEVLLVITPEPTSLTDAYSLLKTLDQMEREDKEQVKIKVITNRVDDFLEAKELYNKLNAVVNKFLKIKIEFLGGIPQDGNVLKSVMVQKPVSVIYPNTIASTAIFELARMINENQTIEQQEHRGITTLFKKLMKTK